MNSARVYPGMLPNSGVEFFMHNGAYVIEGGRVKPFEQISPFALQLLRDCIENDEPAREVLMKMYPNCEMSRVKKMAGCRMGGLDYRADIIDGQIQDGEYWPCPARGNCSEEGILCKLPMVNGERLNSMEIKLLKYISTDYTNEYIAELVGLPKGSFNKAMYLLYQKIGVKTKQEATLIALEHNLL